MGTVLTFSPRPASLPPVPRPCGADDAPPATVVILPVVRISRAVAADQPEQRPNRSR